MKTVISLLVTMISSATLAQEPHADRLSSDQLSRQGRLATVKIIPSSQKIEVYLTGKGVAEIDVSSANLSATLLTPKGKFPLKVGKQKDRFILRGEELNNLGSSRLELRTTIKGEKEDFEFKLD